MSFKSPALLMESSGVNVFFFSSLLLAPPPKVMLRSCTYNHSHPPEKFTLLSIHISRFMSSQNKDGCCVAFSHKSITLLSAGAILLGRLLIKLVSSIFTGRLTGGIGVVRAL